MSMRITLGFMHDVEVMISNEVLNQLRSISWRRKPPEMDDRLAQFRLADAGQVQAQWRKAG